MSSVTYAVVGLYSCLYFVFTLLALGDPTIKNFPSSDNATLAPNLCKSGSVNSACLDSSNAIPPV
jgi:hypothetical protein